MTPMRNRTLNASAGLLTALTLGVASLAGCAPFDPNPAATAGANTPGASTPSTGTPANPGVTPASPGVTAPTAAPIASRAINGTASIGGKPLANASFKVIDLVTGKTLPLVSAGGMNLKTDAEGKFTANVALADAQIAKLVVQGDGASKTVSSIVAGGKGGAVIGIGATGANFKVAEGSTLASNTMSGMFQLVGGSAPAKAAMRQLLQLDVFKAFDLLNSFFSQASNLADSTDNLPQNVKDELLAGVDEAGNVPNSVLEKIFAGNPEFKAAVTIAANNTLTSYAAAGVNSAPNVPDIAADLAIFEALGFKIDVVGDTLDITNEDGVKVTINNEVIDTPEIPDTPEQPLPGDPDPDTGDTELETGITPGNPESSDANAFEPSFSARFDSSNRLVLNVSQEAGQKDVGLIVARIKKSDADADFNTVSALATGNSNEGVSRTFDVTRTNAEGDEVTGLKNPWDVQAEFESPTFIGLWKQSSTRIAKVNIFEDETFIYLVIDNDRTGNSAVTVGLHNTTMTVNSGAMSFNRTKLEALESSAGGTVDVYFQSNDEEETSLRSENIVVDSEAT